jgi:hypothetical protein
LKRACLGYSPFPTFIDGLSLVRIQSEPGNDDGASCCDDDIDLEDAGMMPLVAIPPKLDIDGDVVFATHLMNCLFVGPHVECKPLDLSSWVAVTIQSSHCNSTSRLAVGALAAAYYGKLQCCPPAINRGVMLYTRGLREVQRDLDDSRRVMDTATLANAVILSLYELVTFKSTTGWLTHFLGIGQLVSSSHWLQRLSRWAKLNVDHPPD